jgi:peptidoglycan/xylan/chitin deacetylase (PgdA/CDA1 family)
MYVTPETFANHLRWISETLEVVRLGDWGAAVASGRPVPQRACAITFDDGWRDNFDYAFPLLCDAGLPSTIFVVTGYLGKNRQFWPNRVAHLLRQRPELVTEVSALRWLRDTMARVSVSADGVAHDTDALGRLIHACKDLPDSVIESSLDSIEPIETLDSSTQPRRMLSWEELAEMAESGLVDIGSHTCNHVRLQDALSDDQMAYEIAGSRRALESGTRRKIDLFCYPNGDVTTRAAAVVEKEYRLAVTTRLGINTTMTPKNALLRIGMHEDVSRTKGAFFARLACWL